MPSNIVAQLMRQVSALEARVEALMSYQRWQMGLLAAILLMGIARLVK